MKKLRLMLATLLFLGSFTFLSAAMGTDCKGGVPKLTCAIWNVKVSGGTGGINMDCTTGGSYKCGISI